MRRLALPGVVALSLGWWLLVPLSIGFGLRWLFAGHASAVASVFNPADSSVYMLWLRIGATTGVFFAFAFLRGRIGTPRRMRAALPHGGYRTAIGTGVVAAMFAPFHLRNIETHVTHVPYLVAFALCGALFGIVVTFAADRWVGDDEHEPENLRSSIGVADGQV
jgi:hypothetical protein